MADEPSRKQIASLRPGAPAAAVAAAFGDRWQPPLPHRAGRVLRLAITHGVTVDIDSHDRLGRISFNWLFGETDIVAGLRIGASRIEVLAAHPSLKLGSMAMTRHLEHGSTLLPDGVRLFVELNSGSLEKISLENPDAKYPPHAPLVLTPPAGEPGAPFKDPNLKLAVLTELLDLAEIDLGDVEQFLSAVTGRAVEVEKEGYEKSQAAYDYLVRYPLDQALLDKVTSLVLDGGNSIYPYIWRFWDGETDDFNIHSLEGIETLRNLKRVQFIALADPGRIDLSPLRRMPGVEIRK